MSFLGKRILRSGPLARPLHSAGSGSVGAGVLCLRMGGVRAPTTVLNSTINSTACSLSLSLMAKRVFSSSAARRVIDSSGRTEPGLGAPLSDGPHWEDPRKYLPYGPFSVVPFEPVTPQRTPEEHHRSTIRTLYRRMIRAQWPHNLTGPRFYHFVDLLRTVFEIYRPETDKLKIQSLVSMGYAYIKASQSYLPYVYMHAPQGSSWQRNIPPPIRSLDREGDPYAPENQWATSTKGHHSGVHAADKH